MNASILLQVGVKIFLEGKERKYLLLERSSVRYPRIKNKWDIPGGRIIPGMPIFDNLKREVREETKLRIIGKPRLLAVQDIIRRGEKHIVRITYIGKAAGVPELDYEHKNFKWLTITEMREIKKLDEFTREILETGLLPE